MWQHHNSYSSGFADNAARRQCIEKIKRRCTFEKKLDRVLSRFHSSLYMLADVQEVSNIGVQQPFAPVARCTLPHSQGKNPNVS